MEKPKGGRGHKALYETKQMRVPDKLESQIQELVSRYREWLYQSGYVSGIGIPDPPHLLDKPVDSFNGLAEMQLQLETLREENLALRSQLAEVKAELEEAQAEANSCLDSAAQWQAIAEHAHEQIDQLKSAAGDLETARDRYLASLRVGKQAPEYKRTKTVLDRFIAALQGSI